MWHPPPYRNVVTADSPILYWRLGAAATIPIVDVSGKQNTGTFQGTWTAQQPGALPNDPDFAAKGDGSTSYLSSSTQYTNPTAATLEIWLKTTDTTGGVMLGFADAQTGSAGSSFDRLMYVDSNNKITAGIYNGGAQPIESVSVVNDGAWRHIAFTFDGTAEILYINGLQEAANLSVGAAVSYTGWWRLGNITLNGWTNVPTNKTAPLGWMDEAAIYATSLTAPQILAHYNAGRRGPARPPRAWSVAVAGPGPPLINVSQAVNRGAVW